MIAYRGGPMRTVVYACFSVPVGSALFLPPVTPCLACCVYRTKMPNSELTREV